MIIRNILLSLIVYSSLLFANEDKANDISLLTAKMIYDFNYHDIHKIIDPYLKKNTSIKSLSIRETISDKIIYSKDSSNKLDDLLYIKYDIEYDNEVVATIKMSYKEKSILTLSAEEEKWLKHNRTIRIAVMDYWPHDNYGNSLHTEMLKLINKYSGTNLVPVKFSKWNDGYTKAIRGQEIFGIMGLSWSQERENIHFNYSLSYNFTPSYLIVRNDSDIKTFSDLENKKIYLKTNSILHKMVKKKLANTTVIDIDTVDSMYRELSNNTDASAMISYFISEEKVKENNLQVIETLSDKYGEVSIGLSKKHKHLVSIINKTFTIIPKQEISILRDKNWEEINIENKYALSRSESEYLKKVEELNICINPNLEPIIFEENNEQKGISIDVLNLMKNKLKVKFNYVKTKSIEEAKKYLNENKCDIIPNYIESESKEANFKVSETYLKYKLAIITTQDKPLIHDLDMLKNKTLTIRKDFELIDTIEDRYQDMKIKKVDSLDESLAHLLDKKSYLTLVTLPVFSYYKSKYEINKLQIAGYSDISYDLKILVKKDDKKLLRILNKTISSIPKETINLIHEKWSASKTIKSIDWDFVQKLLVVFIVFLLASLFWIRKINFAKQLAEEATKKAKTAQTQTDIAKKQIEKLHKHVRESIEYASLIQGALLPDEKLMNIYFKDSFVYWLPKDTVGGDIWLLDELRNDNECLLFVIDCTGHGVSGAFVTMIVKAIQREIIFKIKNDPSMEVSPAWILQYFNQTIKMLLKQDNDDSKSNAGFDGGIIYYNKKDKLLKFAGANTSLITVGNENNLKEIKGNRYSVGYKKCAMDYDYKETLIEVEEGMKFYCTTDGYLDQNGGRKDFPFGRKRFRNIIERNNTKSMRQQKNIFISELSEYTSFCDNSERNDDITIVSFEI